jgi:signal transduction histidine kinase
MPEPPFEDSGFLHATLPGDAQDGNAIGESWAVLSVDDDPQVHAITRLSLHGLVFDGRPVEVLSANSAAEAREVLERHPNIRIVLLDIIMESEHAGIELVRHLRGSDRYRSVRLIIRTGQPGVWPPLEVATRYEIDGYCAKGDLTSESLKLQILTALRTAALLGDLEGKTRALAASNEDLARSNAELERFAYVASHDLQAPLRSIVTYIQMLDQRYGKDLHPKARDVLGQVTGLARGMRSLIDDLLAFARVGHGAAVPVPVPLAEIVDQVRADLAPLLMEKGATIEHVDLPVVNGDRSQLKQLFRNLVDNALKFQRSERAHVHITAVSLPAAWEIRVADNGIGIDAQHLKEIFQMFKRLHSVDEFPGTGVGLAICEKVARLHGGSIRAESEPGVGTTMIVTLPQ